MMVETGMPFRPPDRHDAGDQPVPAPAVSIQEKIVTPGVVSIWKEVNSRMPSIDGALHEFFKRNDGTDSLFPKKKDNRNNITLFMERKKAGNKKPEKEYVDPVILEIEFKNDGGGIGIDLDKKKLVLSWAGKISCNEAFDKISCSVKGIPETPAILSSAKTKKPGFRESPTAKKILKRKDQVRDAFKTDHVELWSDPVVNVRDINQIATFGTAASLGASAIATFFLPAAGLLLVSSPMLVGATALANGEAGINNAKGAWYVDGKMGDDEWIGHFRVNPGDVKSVEVFNDDEFYQHVKIQFNKTLTCKLRESSDVVSFYPERRVECDSE